MTTNAETTIARLDRRGLLRSAMPLAVAVIGGGALMACRAQPVHTVSGTPFLSPPRGGMAERQRIILTAAATQGWQASVGRPGGAIIARKSDGSRLVTLEILYNPGSFSFRHIDSSANLLYNGAQAHSLYNDWVRALENAIVQQSA
jgi:hypothetical protein